MTEETTLDLSSLGQKIDSIYEDGWYLAKLKAWEKTPDGGALVSFEFSGSRKCDGQESYYQREGKIPLPAVYPPTAITQKFAPTVIAIRYLKVQLNNVERLGSNWDKPGIVRERLDKLIGQTICIYLRNDKVDGWYDLLMYSYSGD